MSGTRSHAVLAMRSAVRLAIAFLTGGVLTALALSFIPIPSGGLADRQSGAALSGSGAGLLSGAEMPGEEFARVAEQVVADSQKLQGSSASESFGNLFFSRIFPLLALLTILGLITLGVRSWWRWRAVAAALLAEAEDKSALQMALDESGRSQKTAWMLWTGLEKRSSGAGLEALYHNPARIFGVLPASLDDERTARQENGDLASLAILRDRLSREEQNRLHRATGLLMREGDAFDLAMTLTDGQPVRVTGEKLFVDALPTGMLSADSLTRLCAGEGRQEEPDAKGSASGEQGENPCETDPAEGTTLVMLSIQDDGLRAGLDRRAVELMQAGSELSALKHLLDHLPLPVWMRDVQGNLLYGNSFYRDLEETALNEKGMAGSETLAVRALEQNSEQVENRHIVVQGAYRLYEFVESPLKALQGRGRRTPSRKELPVLLRENEDLLEAARPFAEPALVGCGQDLTALEQAQAELSRHLKAHDEMLENLSSPIAVFGPDKRLKFFNSAFLRMAGMQTASDREWLLREPLMTEMLEMLRERRRLPEYADFPAFKRSRDRLFTTVIDPFEELLHLPDDSTWRMVIAPHPLGGLIFTYENVTDKLSLERSYNTLIAVQRETLNNLHEGIAVFGSDGRLKLFNPVYQDVWRLTPMMLAHEPHINDIVANTQHFFGRDANWPDYREWAISRVTDPVSETGRLERADGSVVDYACVPLPDGGVMFSYLDISASVKAQTTLQERNNALERANRLRTEFVSNLTGELRTPINQVIGLADMLANGLMGQLGWKQLGSVSNILDSANRLKGMIRDILDLSTIEDGRVEIQARNLNVNELLQSLITLCAERARHADIEVRLECPADITPMEADERLLKQALYKLLANALKYTPEGGRVTLSACASTCRLEGGAGEEACCIAISVTDTGPGFHDHDLQRLSGELDLAASALHKPAEQRPAPAEEPLPLFRHLEEDNDPAALKQDEKALMSDFADMRDLLPGERADDTAATGQDILLQDDPRSKAGSNLGLTLARRFVELHGGWLEVGSGDGGGGCVTCILPRRVISRSGPTEEQGQLPIPELQEIRGVA